MSNRAVLVFGTSTPGTMVRLSVPRAYADITEPDARAAMAAIIDTGAVVTAQGRPLSAYSARVESTLRQRLV